MNIEENKLQEENQSEKIGFLCGISLNDLTAYRYVLKDATALWNAYKVTIIFSVSTMV